MKEALYNAVINAWLTNQHSFRELYSVYHTIFDNYFEYMDSLEGGGGCERP